MNTPRKCGDVHKLLFELVDRTLTDEECRRLQEHCQSCPHCQALLRAEQEFRVMLRQCCFGKAPETLRRRIEISISTVRIERRSD